MDHEQLKQRLSEYLDGTLEGAERLQVETHLKACAECHAFCSNWRVVSQNLFVRPSEIASSEAFVRNVMDRLESIGRKRVTTLIPVSWFAPIFGAVAILFLAVMPSPAQNFVPDALLTGTGEGAAQWMITGERPRNDEMLNFILEGV